MPAASAFAAPLLARIEGLVLLDLRVLDARALTGEVAELRLSGAPAAFAPWPGQDLMLGLTDRRGSHRWRRYTVRRLEDGTVTLWVTTQTEGPGAAFARAAAPGVRVESLGPRGKIAVRSGVRRHLFVVDESGAAAAAAMAESLRAGTTAHVLAPQEILEAAMATLAAGVEVGSTALVTSSATSADPDALDEALRGALGASPDDVACYVFGELRLVRQVRDGLLAAGADEALVAHKAYWRADASNQDHGEPDRSE